MEKIMYKNFWGSTVALLFGIYLLFSIFAPLDEYPDTIGTFFSGLLIIIGSLSYKSAKKRKLGLVKNNGIRQYMEIAGLMICFVLAIYQDNLFMNYVFLVWIVSGYIIVRQKSTRIDIEPAHEAASKNRDA